MENCFFTQARRPAPSLRSRCVSSEWDEYSQRWEQAGKAEPCLFSASRRRISFFPPQFRVNHKLFRLSVFKNCTNPAAVSILAKHNSQIGVRTQFMLKKSNPDST